MASATLAGCSSSTIPASPTFIQVAKAGSSRPLRVTVASMWGLWSPTMFKTGMDSDR